MGYYGNSFLKFYIPLFTTALDNKGADLIVQFIGSQELFNGEMHAITPVVTGISGDIDALGILIGQTKLLVDTHPVLE